MPIDPARGRRWADHRGAQCRRAVHRPTQAVAWPGPADGQTHHRLPGRTSHCVHPCLGASVTWLRKPAAQTRDEAREGRCHNPPLAQKGVPPEVTADDAGIRGVGPEVESQGAIITGVASGGDQHCLFNVKPRKFEWGDVPASACLAKEGGVRIIGEHVHRLGRVRHLLGVRHEAKWVLEPRNGLRQHHITRVTPEVAINERRQQGGQSKSTDCRRRHGAQLRTADSTKETRSRPPRASATPTCSSAADGVRACA